MSDDLELTLTGRQFLMVRDSVYRNRLDRRDCIKPEYEQLLASIDSQGQAQDEFNQVLFDAKEAMKGKLKRRKTDGGV